MFSMKMEYMNNDILRKYNHLIFEDEKLSVHYRDSVPNVIVDIDGVRYDIPERFRHTNWVDIENGCFVGIIPNTALIEVILATYRNMLNKSFSMKCVIKEEVPQC